MLKWQFQGVLKVAILRLLKNVSFKKPEKWQFGSLDVTINFSEN